MVPNYFAIILIFVTGFFKRHKDFLSTTSNLIEEYTLLLCVTPDQAGGVIGGNTTIHTFGGAKTFDTTTTGSGILFRKDLEHEGMELTSGEKHNITGKYLGHSYRTVEASSPCYFPSQGKRGD